VVELADSRTLYENPLHPYTKALLSAIPIPVLHSGKKRIVIEGDVPSPMNKPTGCPFHTRCPKCMEICKTKPPILSDTDGNGHFTACHLYPKSSAADA